MKTWILAALLLVLPTVHAEPAPAHQRETVVEDKTLHVTEQLDWSYSNAADYDGIARFYASSSASNLSVSLVQGAATRAVANLQKTASGVPDYDLYRIDLRSLQSTVSAGTKYSVLVQYELTGTVAPLRTFYALESMTLFVKPAEGQSPHSVLFGEFVPVGYDSYHSARTGVPANTTYTVSFSAGAAPASSSDMTKWLWLAGGIVVGALLIMVGKRRGEKGKKFSKGGEMESRSMLEARRRTLLAALKDLEAAHELKEIPDDAYAPLKEEYKAQAVRVMRSLEEKKEG